MESATSRPQHYWGRTAWVDPPYTREEIILLPVSQRLLHLMIQDGEVWNSTRAVAALQDHGWVSRSKYPINVAGNMLMRWEQRGVLNKISDGVYIPKAVHTKEGQYLWDLMKSETGETKSDDFA
jgi:hypothetical protein